MHTLPTPRPPPSPPLQARGAAARPPPADAADRLPGPDHDGAHYFALPEAVESDGDSDDDADDDDEAPAAPEQKKAERVRLIVESRDGSVGELVGDRFKKALRTSKDERDRRLLHAPRSTRRSSGWASDAGPATTKITKTTHGDYEPDGHA